MNTLQLTEDQIIDHSIKSSQYVRYEPATGTSLNNNGTQIRFEVNLTDQFTYPAGSYLTFKGKLTKADGSLYSDTDEISLTHNGIIHLFSNIKFQVGGTEIESVNNPGHSSNMLGLLTYNDDLNNFRGLNQCWTKDTDNSTSLTTNAGFKKRQDFIIQQPNTKGNFSFAVPLNHILGFADDYDKVLYGSRQTLTLVRQHDSDAIFKKSTVAAKKSLSIKYIGISHKSNRILRKIYDCMNSLNRKFLSQLHSDQDIVNQSMFLKAQHLPGIYVNLLKQLNLLLLDFKPIEMKINQRTQLYMITVM